MRAMTLNLLDTVEPNMEYIGQIDWHINWTSRSRLPYVCLFDKYIPYWVRKQCPVKVLSYLAHLPFLNDLVSRVKH